jgi:ribosomal protein L18
VTTQTEITQRNHHRAVRFFWGFLIGATTVSLIGNMTHAVLPCIPRVVIQIGAATVPPIALLAAVHGIALAVRAGASGRVYSWSVGAVAAIGVGAFAVSFLALRDLMQAIGYSYTTAWIFPAIIDTAVAVSTLMLVALGDKPARRARTVTTPANTQPPTTQRLSQRLSQSAKAEVTRFSANNFRAQTVQAERGQTCVSGQPDLAQIQDSAQTEAMQADADLASELIASGVTTQPVETVVAVLAACRDGASINAAAKASGINYRTAQRIVAAAAEHRQLLAVS